MSKEEVGLEINFYLAGSFYAGTQSKFWLFLISTYIQLDIAYLRSEKNIFSTHNIGLHTVSFWIVNCCIIKRSIFLDHFKR